MQRTGKVACWMVTGWAGRRETLDADKGCSMAEREFQRQIRGVTVEKGASEPEIIMLDVPRNFQQD